MAARTVTALVATIVMAAGCSGDDRDADGASTTVAVVPVTTPPATGPTDDLAPSQITAATVPPPDIPPPCDPAELSFWTAQVRFVDMIAEAVVRVRNDARDWCEVDVFSSPLVDPAIEPDVWLQPGEWADLVVGADPNSDVDCVTANVVTLAPLVVNGEPVDVPTSAVVPCSWWLTAFSVIDPPADPCAAEQLDALLVDGSVLVRNAAPSACELGEVVAADGAESADRPSPPDPEVTALAPGDVAAVPVAGLMGTSCGDQTATISFGGGASVEVSGLGRCFVVTLGAAEPFFDGVDGPLRDMAVDALAALDPFDDLAGDRT